MHSKKIYAYTARLIVVICIGVVSTIACSRYSPRYHIKTKDKSIDDAQTDKDKEALDKSRLFQVDENGMTPFCKAIKEGNYKKLEDLLKEIEELDPNISDHVIYLITGCKINKKDKKQHPEMALLVQVITSYEDEISEYTYTEKLLNKLFKIICNYGFDLKEVFSKKHGQDQDTLMHLVADTAHLPILKCLIGWYPKKDGDHDHLGQMTVCSIPNHWDKTPLWKVAKAMYDHPLICGRHEYDDGCETCDHTIEMKIKQEDIMLYLLKLGVPLFETTPSKIDSVLHYFVKHDPGDFSIEMINTIEKRGINKHTLEDLVSIPDRKGNTLLFYAVRCRNYKLAKHLLASGACPMQFNHKGNCPIFCAIALRDLKMVKYLSQAKCILERICNINEPSSNGLTAQDLAKSPDGGGISPLLENYCNRFKEKYGRQIVDSRWDWKPNHKIEQLVSYLSNYCALQTKKDLHLHFHSRLGRNRQSGKREHTDSYNKGYGSSGSMNQNKRPRILYKITTSFDRNTSPPVFCFSPHSTISGGLPFGGG